MPFSFEMVTTFGKSHGPATDCELNPFQRPSGTPLFLKPINRNWWSAIGCISAATSLANRDLANNQPFCGQRKLAALIHPVPPTLQQPVRPPALFSIRARLQTIERRIREPAYLRTRPAEAVLLNLG